MLVPSLASTELPSICETSSEESGSFIGVLLADGALLVGGAAARDGAAAPGPDIDDCAEAPPAPKASRAATAAAVANFGTTRVMTKPR
jgi:hypothetical protein